MAKLKAHYLSSLAHLLSLGAGSDFAHVTTESLGKAIGRSQQAASAHMAELEGAGYIERQMRGRSSHVLVTKKGTTEVRRVMVALSKSLGDDADNGRPFLGKLSSGVGEGAYYMSLAGYVVQFKKKIGYIPYPGTLNVTLQDKSATMLLHIATSKEPDALIGGFSDGRRTYGWVKCYGCTVGGKKCHLIRLERTHHDEGLVEIISRTNLRRACHLQDGSKVSIRMSDGAKN